MVIRSDVQGFRRSIIAAAVLVLGCGGDSGADHPVAPPPATKSTISLSIVSGFSATDTIGAVLREPIAIELRDGAGTLLAGYPILFESVPVTDATGASRYLAYFGASGGQMMTAVQAVTNTVGHAAVPVLLGDVSGPAQIAVSVPGSSAKQIVTIFVAPGAPTRFAFLPPDTAVVVGGATKLRAGGVDRAGNVGIADVVYAPSPHPEIATVSSTGVVSGVATGTISVSARLGPYPGTGRVEVVPRATIAAYYGASADGDSSGIVTLNLDGSGRRWVARAYGSLDGPPAPIWGPDDVLIYTAPPPGRTYDHGRLLVTAPGTIPTLLNPLGTPGALYESWPQYNAATRTVFYSGLTPGGQWQLYSRAPDGTTSLISPEGPSVPTTLPSPSPDGTKLAYVEDYFGAPVLRVYDLVTRTTSTWSVAGSAPRWSPLGDRIAYAPANSDALAVVNADGTGAHTLVGGVTAPFSWSPDGAWMLANSGGTVHLINTTTGESLVLSYLNSYYYSSWK